ncbi:hypothetical protein CXB51_017163 [Gossypium anomalum]|uniref:Uncharacterized protein n=1 Tax=Gossypium anomalum TaxID=47600 RepID=A0A8J6D0M3_9ROSI|nr:hypothetical protein CXB51_017163 [Gossypium anomalum]
MDMLVDPELVSSLSWKDRLLGRGSSRNGEIGPDLGVSNEEDLILLEEYVTSSTMNGTPSIEFSDKIQQILYKRMESTMVLKLLGRSFQCIEDYVKVL